MLLLRYLRHMELKQRTGRYVLYAIGEIFLVVVGILIALQINNWNEGRKRDQQRLVLIENLKRDFALTLDQMDESLESLTTIKSAYEQFLEAAGNDTTDLSAEELKSIINTSLKALLFQPVLGTLNSAQSTGEFGLIKDSEFINLIAKFERNFMIWNDLSAIYRQQVFLEHRPELRKKLGSLRGTIDTSWHFNPPRYALSEEAFWQVIYDKEVYANFEAFHFTRNAQTNILKSLKETTEEILKRLEEL